MAFQQTSTGLQIQTVAEITAEMETDYRAAFGTDVDLTPASVFGVFIRIQAERESLMQQLVQRVQGGFSRNGAEGADLDSVVELGGSLRLSASQSKADAGRCVGTPAVTVLDGSTVIQDGTGDVWDIVDGPDPGPGYLIGGGGDVTNVFIESQLTGVKTFLTASTFTIGTPIAGWASFEVERDIELSETGRDIEADGALRPRSRDEFFINGNDLSGIKAAVTKVPGVTDVKVFENRDCTQTVDGIEAGAIEVLVDGTATDLDIATAILDRAPPGTITSGTISQGLADGEGNTITIKFSPPADVEIHVEIQLRIGDAEGTLPEDFDTVVTAIVLAVGNENARVGQDVLWQQFIGPIFLGIQDTFSLKFPVTEVVSKVGLAMDPPADTNVSIDNRSRADFDSARVVVQVIA